MRRRGRRRGRRRRSSTSEAIDLDAIRPDLAEVLDRHAMTLDEARPDAVARRRATQPAHRPRERRRPVRPGHVRRVRPAGDRRAAAPAHARRPDRTHAGRRPGRGHRRVNGDLFADADARCVVMSYDYTVLAGTQGAAEPPQEGPPVRARRALAAAGRVLHRGRRRPPGRHRRHRRRRPRLHGVRPVRPR